MGIVVDPNVKVKSLINVQPVESKQIILRKESSDAVIGSLHPIKMSDCFLV